MRAIDTNVIVRLLVRDDELQLRRAEAFVAAGAWVSLLVLMETSWVLESVYDRSSAQIARGIELLLNNESLVVQDADLVGRAVEVFRRFPALGLSDCLIVEQARKSGHVPLGTFDRRLAKSAGAVRI